MSMMLTADAYGKVHGISARQVQRYAIDGRLAGAVKNPAGQWLIPEDCPHPQSFLASAAAAQDVAVAGPTSGDVVVAEVRGPQSRAIPPGLWDLKDVAEFWGTSVGGVKRLVADGHLGFIGPYGPMGRRMLFVPTPAQMSLSSNDMAQIIAMLTEAARG